jgi:hypothetical protein
MSGPYQSTNTCRSRMLTRATYGMMSFADSLFGRNQGFGWLGSRSPGHPHLSSTPLPVCPCHYHHRPPHFRSCPGRPLLR